MRGVPPNPQELRRKQLARAKRKKNKKSKEKQSNNAKGQKDSSRVAADTDPSMESCERLSAELIPPVVVPNSSPDKMKNTNKEGKLPTPKDKTTMNEGNATKKSGKENENAKEEKNDAPKKVEDNSAMKNVRKKSSNGRSTTPPGNSKTTTEEETGNNPPTNGSLGPNKAAEKMSTPPTKPDNENPESSSGTPERAVAFKEMESMSVVQRRMFRIKQIITELGTIKARHTKIKADADSWRLRYEKRLIDLDVSMTTMDKKIKRNMTRIMSNITLLEQTSIRNSEKRNYIKRHLIRQLPNNPAQRLSIRITHAFVNILHTVLYYIAIIRDILFFTRVETPTNNSTKRLIYGFEKKPNE